MAKQRRVRARPARKKSAAFRSKISPVKLPKAIAPQAPPVPDKRPSYLEAVALYEQGVEALQRHAYAQAAELLRAVLDRYPEERELHERVRLYLRVCERQASPPVSLPQTAQERVYAATLALNASRYEEALSHLLPVVEQDPDHEHAHYMLAVSYALRGEPEPARAHLRRAIELNPENRALARHDPDFETMRHDEGFRQVLEVASVPPRRRLRGRLLR